MTFSVASTEAIRARFPTKTQERLDFRTSCACRFLVVIAVDWHNPSFGWEPVSYHETYRKPEEADMFRTGIGVDLHKFAAGRKLVLGGVKIDHPCGLAGHSDADVLSHAVADALLGAVAAGDIGSHFPNTDPKWKDAASLDLLATTAGIVSEKGGRIVNVDVTVIAQEPRIASFIEEMRDNLAAAIGVERGRVSVKATTPEGMGALGRREGISATAIATVETEA